MASSHVSKGLAGMPLQVDVTEGLVLRMRVMPDPSTASQAIAHYLSEDAGPVVLSSSFRLEDLTDDPHAVSRLIADTTRVPGIGSTSHLFFQSLQAAARRNVESGDESRMPVAVAVLAATPPRTPIARMADGWSLLLGRIEPPYRHLPVRDGRQPEPLWAPEQLPDPACAAGRVLAMLEAAARVIDRTDLFGKVARNAYGYESVERFVLGGIVDTPEFLRQLEQCVPALLQFYEIAATDFDVQTTLGEAVPGRGLGTLVGVAMSHPIELLGGYGLIGLDRDSGSAGNSSVLG